METALMLYQVRDEGVLTGLFLGLAASLAVAWAWFRYGALVNVRRFFQVTGVFLLVFVVQIGFNALHEFSEAGLLPSSEAVHEATEPFTPYGRYGRWFSLAMVLVCVGWLVMAQIRDRLRGSPAVGYQNAK
jgi:high-affinity iron transporter